MDGIIFYIFKSNIARKCKINVRHNYFRSQAEVDTFLSTHQVTLKGRDVPRPIQFFEEGNFPDLVMGCIRKQGFEQPTPIQGVGWPIALSGRDMVGIAQTGSGKTLAVGVITLTFLNFNALLFLEIC